MLNMLDYIVASPSFSEANHLASKQAGVNPLYCSYDVETGWLWYMKGANGFPWDGNFVDVVHGTVLQCITEGPNTWPTKANPAGDPSSYKAFDSKSALAVHGGIVWCATSLDEDGLYLPYSSDSTYNTYDKGVLVKQQNLGGNTITVPEGPYELSVGDLGQLNVMIINYIRPDGFLERNWYGRDAANQVSYGWCRWQSHQLINGVYVLQTDNLFDQITPGGTPALNFPNPLP
jgi:hypothetical protein